MRRITRTAGTAAVCALLATAIIPAVSSTASAAIIIHQGVNATSARAATAAAKAVVSFRADLNGLLASYVRDYGDRLSESELAQAKTLIAQADSSLDGVQAASALTASLASSGASKARVLAAARAAEKAFTTSHDQALAALNKVTPLLQPKLGLFEAFGAKRDADAKLAKFAALGTQLTAVTKAVNASR